MKVKILKPCTDGKTGKHLVVGDIIELTKERFAKAPQGYVEAIPESTQHKQTRKKKG